MKASILGAVLATALFTSVTAGASTVIDFHAVSLRGANAVPHAMATVSEYASGDGASIGSLVAGQKTYYGTDFFSGSTVGSLGDITFTYRPADAVSPAPYMNLAITNGTVTGVLTFGFSATPDLLNNGDGSFTATYNFSEAASLRLVEVTGGAFSGTPSFADISSWLLVSGTRTTSSGEDAGYGPRAPIADSLAIMWGDSANNYLGNKEIYDVTVVRGREEYVAGNEVPEPASIALVGAALLGLAATRRRSR